MPAEGSVVGSLFSGMRSYISKEIQKTAEIGKALGEKAATRVQNYTQDLNPALSARSDASSHRSSHRAVKVEPPVAAVRRPVEQPHFDALSCLDAMSGKVIKHLVAENQRLRGLVRPNEDAAPLPEVEPLQVSESAEFDCEEEYRRLKALHDKHGLRMDVPEAWVGIFY